MSKHTPTPWKTLQHFSEGVHDGNLVIGPDGWHVAACWHQLSGGRHIEECDANAEFIVRAVNSHDELLSIVKDIFLDDHSDYSDGERCDECGTRRESSDQTECDAPGCWYVRIREAVRKAEGRD